MEQRRQSNRDLKRSQPGNHNTTMTATISLVFISCQHTERSPQQLFHTVLRLIQPPGICLELVVGLIENSAS